MTFTSTGSFSLTDIYIDTINHRVYMVDYSYTTLPETLALLRRPTSHNGVALLIPVEVIEHLREFATLRKAMRYMTEIGAQLDSTYVLSQDYGTVKSTHM